MEMILPEKGGDYLWVKRKDWFGCGIYWRLQILKLQKQESINIFNEVGECVITQQNLAIVSGPIQVGLDQLSLGTYIV